MNAIPLFHADGRPANVWYCETCRLVAKDQTTADACCPVYTCKYCGKIVVEKFYRDCRECGSQARERENFQKARKLLDFDGWVYTDVLGYNDGYFSSVWDMIEHCESEDIELPEYVWTCEASPFRVPSVGRIVEWSSDDSFEDIGDRITITPTLQLALDEYAKANENLVSYSPNYKVAVLLCIQGPGRDADPGGILLGHKPEVESAVPC